MYANKNRRRPRVEQLGDRTTPVLVALLLPAKQVVQEAAVQAAREAAVRVTVRVDVAQSATAVQHTVTPGGAAAQAASNFTQMGATRAGGEVVSSDQY